MTLPRRPFCTQNIIIRYQVEWAIFLQTNAKNINFNRVSFQNISRSSTIQKEHLKNRVGSKNLTSKFSQSLRVSLTMGQIGQTFFFLSFYKFVFRNILQGYLLFFVNTLMFIERADYRKVGSPICLMDMDTPKGTPVWSGIEIQFFWWYNFFKMSIPSSTST